MRVARDIGVHRADCRASSAMDAFCFIYCNAEQRQPVPETVPKSERTEESAERPIDCRHGQQENGQQRSLPNGQPTRRRKYFRAERQERKGAFQRPGGTNPSAEQRFSRSRRQIHEICADGSERQHRLPEARQTAHPRLPFKLRHRHAMQDVLHQSERAEPAADCTTESQREQKQQPKHV